SSKRNYRTLRRTHGSKRQKLHLRRRAQNRPRSRTRMDSAQLIHEAREGLVQRRGREYVIAADVIVEALLETVKDVAKAADLNEAKLAGTVLDSLALIQAITFKVRHREDQ